MKHIILVAMILLAAAAVATVATAAEDGQKVQMGEPGDGGENALEHCEQARLDGENEDAGQQATMQLHHRLNASST